MIDVISKKWLATAFSPEETSIQVEVAFIAALEADGKGWLLEDAVFAEELASGHIPDPAINSDDPDAQPDTDTPGSPDPNDVVPHRSDHGDGQYRAVTTPTTSNTDSLG